MNKPSLGNLHHFILSHVINRQYAPEIDTIARHYNISIEDTTNRLQDLADYHGVVLHPNSFKIWVIHPVSLSPTVFKVLSKARQWWGTCAWCSFGLAHLVEEDVTIESRIGAEGDLVRLEIKNKELINVDYVVHFPIKMTEAWNNVIYTCSVMLLFRNETEVDNWCLTHNIPKGDVQPVSKIFKFAGEWYGNHLKYDWKKWTNKEARDLFEKFGLESDIWKIPVSKERF